MSLMVVVAVDDANAKSKVKRETERKMKTKREKRKHLNGNKLEKSLSFHQNLQLQRESSINKGEVRGKSRLAGRRKLRLCWNKASRQNHIIAF